MARSTLPARYPPSGTWPAQMRADMAAAYLDYRDTSELAAAISRGQAPPPSSLRGSGRRREPVWARVELDRCVAFTALPSESGVPAKENLTALV
jgi:hypothetical protein